MKNESGFSPVIGEILMIVITIVLAAVVAYFVFGVSGMVTDTNKQTTMFKTTITIKEGSSGRFIDTDGKGYVQANGIYVIGNKYDITYYIDPTTHERTVTKALPNDTGMAANPYVCQIENGVCK